MYHEDQSILDRILTLIVVFPKLIDELSKTNEIEIEKSEEEELILYRDHEYVVRDNLLLIQIQLIVHVDQFQFVVNDLELIVILFEN